MADQKIDAKKFKTILDKTVEAINSSKKEIFEIGESARKECKNLEKELDMLKQQVKELIDIVEILEVDLKDSKRKLLLVNKNFEKFSQESLKEAYEKADNLRVELAVKREQEQNLIRRRNDLEIRIKDSYKTIQKAESLMSQIGAALSYLTGELQEIGFHMEDMQQRTELGIRIIKAQEDERQRVAREIHDGPAQSMSNVVLKAEICEKLIDVDILKAKEELRELKRVVRDCLRDVRMIIYNLRPMSLDDLGLVPTLQRYIATYHEENGINISFKTSGVFDDIRPMISLAAFRIIQEALSNIKKHAHAENVTINLEFLEDKLKVYVYDDGTGFDITSLKSRAENVNSGFGLFSMRERIELLNGKIDMDSSPGKGTRLNVTLPLIQDEGAKNEKD